MTATTDETNKILCKATDCDKTSSPLYVQSPVIKNNMDKIALRVRPLDWLECYNETLAASVGFDKRFDIPFRSFGPNLTISLCYNHTDTDLEIIHSQMLDKEGISENEAFAQAIDNLFKENVSESIIELKEGIFVSKARNLNDASLMLFKEWISELPIKGKPVAFIPHRDCLLITGSEDAEGLKDCISISFDEIQDQGGLTGYAYILNGQNTEKLEWGVLALSEEHPCFSAYRKLNYLYKQGNYDLIGEALKKRFGEQIDVSALDLVEKDGQVYSITTWTQAKHCFLPQADFIVLLDKLRSPMLPEQGAGNVMLPFEIVNKICKSIMTGTEGANKYYDAPSFPNSQQIKALYEAYIELNEVAGVEVKIMVKRG
jgi:hypothetical protein